MLQRILPILISMILGAALIGPQLVNQGYLLRTMDGGIFMYIGQQWLNGEILYRDLWDHKPPVLYIFNAIGVWLGRGNPLGVGLIDWLITIVFGLLFFRINRSRSLPATVTALATVSLWLCRHNTVNVAEFYALPFHLLVLHLLISDIENIQPGRHALTIGLCVAVVFFLRPNMIASGGVYMLVMLWRVGWIERTRIVLRFAAGATAITSVLIGIVYWRGSLEGFWEAAYRFNMQYVAISNPLYKVIYPLWGGAELAENGLLMMAMAVAFWALRWRLSSSAVPAVVLYSSIILLIELLTGAVSGRLYEHYLFPALAPAAVLLAWTLDRIFAGLKAVELQNTPGQPSLPWALATTSIATLILISAHMAWKESKIVPKETGLTARLESMLRPGDRSYIWVDGRLSPHFVLGHPSASPYFSATPIIQNQKLFQNRMATLLHDLEAQPPRALADCGWNIVSLLPGSRKQLGLADAEPMADWITPSIEQARQRLETRYQSVWADKNTQCVIYSRLEINVKTPASSSIKNSTP